MEYIWFPYLFFRAVSMSRGSSDVPWIKVCDFGVAKFQVQAGTWGQMTNQADRLIPHHPSSVMSVIREVKDILIFSEKLVWRRQIIQDEGKTCLILNSQDLGRIWKKNKSVNSCTSCTNFCPLFCVSNSRTLVRQAHSIGWRLKCGPAPHMMRRYLKPHFVTGGTYAWCHIYKWKIQTKLTLYFTHLYTNTFISFVQNLYFKLYRWLKYQ